MSEHYDIVTDDVTTAGLHQMSDEMKEEQKKAQAKVAEATRAVLETQKKIEKIEMDEVDYLKHQLIVEKAKRAQIAIEACQMQLDHLVEDRETVRKEASLYLQGVEEKYGVDLRKMVINDDGTITARAPRPPKGMQVQTRG